MSLLHIFSNNIRITFTNNSKINIIKPLLDIYDGLDLSQYYVYPKEDEYIRVKLPVTNSNDNFEIYLINWGPHSETMIHEHPENGCILKILHGELYENVYSANGIITKNIYSQNDISYLDNSIGTHKIMNNNNTISRSLHVYSPPNFYDKL